MKHTTKECRSAGLENCVTIWGGETVEFILDKYIFNIIITEWQSL